MLTKFGEGLGGKLAEQWLSALLTPASAFWAGGLLAWIWRHGLGDLVQWWRGLSSVEQIAVLVGSLLLVVSSAGLIRRFELPLLRLLEGYWPHRIELLRSWLVGRQKAQFDSQEQSWQALAIKEPDGLRTSERLEYVQLEHALRFYPDRDDLMPSVLGNRLRAAESWPHIKYGLDGIICWPRLWLALPDSVQTEIAQAREALNADVRIVAWGTLFLVWTIWAWWAIPVALLAIFFGYRSAVNSAETYGELAESAFDLHRWDLYKALHWPPPATPAEEREIGLQVTEYLWRGSDAETPVFETKSEEE